ncbi:MAG: glycosyltransferase family 4 protein, partial [Candidatus Omnitrophota bacterium]|nr:glycosyltransferase family 4 protein [Candidatus Omnitrophota bacterium]
PFLIRSINPTVDILALIHICSIYIKLKSELVHTHSSKAGIIGRWAARFAKVPVIIHTVHGWSFNDFQPRLLKRLFILLERITAGFTTKIVCVSERDLQIGVKYNIAPREKFQVIKYGIPLAKFRESSIDPVAKKLELGIRNNDPVVGMISCLKKQKSPLDFIKASIKIYEKIPGVNFLLIGDGILKSECKKLLSRSPLNGRFIFTGWRRDISEILDILDVSVLTSKWEGMPIAIIEALSKGCPCVATDVGGSSELVKNGITGYLTRPGAYEDTANRVLYMLQNKDSYSSMKKAAISFIDNNFALDRMLKDIDSLYMKAARGIT